MKPINTLSQGVRYYLFIIIGLLVFTPANAINFKEIAYIPEGHPGSSASFIRAFDTDHNGLPEIIFTVLRGVGNAYIIDYEYRPFNNYVVVDTLVFWEAAILWDVGYLDNDSLCDILTQKPNTDSFPVYESPDYNSYPDSLVWIGGFEGMSISPSYITDLDRDGKNEILTSDGQWYITYIYENTHDNQYELVFTDSVYFYFGFFAFDDFDGDGLFEFVTSGTRGEVVLWECAGDNQYEVVWVDTIWLSPGMGNSNAYDDVSANDMDQDGKPEFIIGSHHTAFKSFDWRWTAVFCFFEATGNNTYQEIYRDSVTNIITPEVVYFSASYCGDIDADGIPEAVMSVGNNWCIYKATGNNTFERIFTAYPSGTGNGRTNTYLFIYDVNQNGYNEIIESGAWTYDSSATKIWEIEAVRLIHPNGGEVFNPDSLVTIHWRLFDPPGADSISLFLSLDGGENYQTLTCGVPASESTYLWTVPDTTSDSCKIMIWAYGPGVGWDFSDSLFAINETGIQEISECIEKPFLYISPNPFRDKTEIGFCIKHRAKSIELKIYDMSGRLVKSFPLTTNLSALSTSVSWDGEDNSGHQVPGGLYFVRLTVSPVGETSGKSITRKIIKLK